MNEILSSRPSDLVPLIRVGEFLVEEGGLVLLFGLEVRGLLLRLPPEPTVISGTGPDLLSTFRVFKASFKY